MRLSAARIASLTLVTASYGWVALVVPIVVAAPPYFAGQLTFGELMVTVGAFNQVQQSLRWLVDNSSAIAEWRATLGRVESFRSGLQSLDGPGEKGSRIVFSENSSRLRLSDVVVRVAARGISLDVPCLEIQPGERVLIVGRSGLDKSVFFRAIAGLWPWGKGTVELPPPADTALLHAQSFIAPGSVREILTYPADPGTFNEKNLKYALERTNLGHLVPSLDRVTRWDKTLTIEERLSLSFAQLLVHRPKWIVADDSVSQLNDQDRKMVQSLFDNELSHSAIVSITSRDTPDAFYSRVLHLVPLESF